MVNRVETNAASNILIHSRAQNSKRSSALMGNNTVQKQSKPTNADATVDISDEARKILKGGGELGKNSALKDDLMKSKSSLKNNSENSLEGISLKDASAKIDEYKSKSVINIDNEVKNDFSNQFVQNEFLDKIDDLYLKTMNEMLQNTADEMRNVSGMVISLIKGIGMSNIGNRINYTDEGIAKLMELYKKHLEAGTLDPEYAEIRDMDAFNSYCQEYYENKENFANKRETFTLLLQKTEELKNMFLQLFEEY